MSHIKHTLNVYLSTSCMSGIMFGVSGNEVMKRATKDNSLNEGKGGKE